MFPNMKLTNTLQTMRQTTEINRNFKHVLSVALSTCKIDLVGNLKTFIKNPYFFEHLGVL